MNKDTEQNEIEFLLAIITMTSNMLLLQPWHKIICRKTIKGNMACEDFTVQSRIFWFQLGTCQAPDDYSISTCSRDRGTLDE